MWVDLDVYCLRPIDYEKEYYFGINYKKGTVNNCVLKIPRHSVALHLVRNFLEARVPIPFWWRKQRLDPLLDQISAGRFTNAEFSTLDDNWPECVDMGLAHHGRNQQWTKFFALLAF